MRNTAVAETRKIRSLLDQNLKRSLTFEMKFDACLKTSTRLRLLQVVEKGGVVNVVGGVLRLSATR